MTAYLMRVIIDHAWIIFCGQWIERGQLIDQPIEVRRDILSGQRVGDPRLGFGRAFTAVYLTTASFARVSPLMWPAYFSNAVAPLIEIRRAIIGAGDAGPWPLTWPRMASTMCGATSSRSCIVLQRAAEIMQHPRLKIEPRVEPRLALAPAAEAALPRPKTNSLPSRGSRACKIDNASGDSGMT